MPSCFPSWRNRPAGMRSGEGSEGRGVALVTAQASGGGAPTCAQSEGRAKGQAGEEGWRASPSRGLVRLSLGLILNLVKFIRTFYVFTKKWNLCSSFVFDFTNTSLEGGAEEIRPHTWQLVPAAPLIRLNRRCCWAPYGGQGATLVLLDNIRMICKLINQIRSLFSII
jgi:hypothetical protein